ncbi:MAG: peptidylprolyl isomerase [Sphaerochaetaceae bacterium]|nr:peptidylprolyl isomerase [Sphaerochaetaceae bacterium]
MNRKTFLAIMVLAVLACASAFAAVATPAATVNLIRTTLISTTQLDSAVQSYKSQGYTNVSSLQVLQLMIGQELLLQGAERDGIKLTEDQKDQLLASQKSSIESQTGATYTDDQFDELLQSQAGMTRAQYRDSIAQQYILQAYVTQTKSSMFTPTSINPTDKEVETFYRKNASQFVNPEAVRIALVLIPKTGDATKDAASLKTLQDALSQIQSGKLTFEKAVSTYSQDTASKSKGGEVGWIAIDNTTYQNLFGDAFYDAAFDLDDGEIAPSVVDSNVGYAIIKVLQHTQFKVLSLTDALSPTETSTVSDYIVYLLQQQKLQEIYTEASNLMIADLTKQAKINILYKEAN